MMRRRLWLGGVASALALGALPAHAQPRPPAARPRRRHPPLLIRGATLWDATALPRGTSILVDDGVIQKVGLDLAPPAGATVVDAAGKAVTPGFVDLLTGVGAVEVDLESTTQNDRQPAESPIRAGFQVADGWDAASEIIPVTRLGGVTSVGVIPRGGLVAGRSAWADLDGHSAEQALALPRLALHVWLSDAWSGSDREGGIGASFLRLRRFLDDCKSFARDPAGFERRQMRALAAAPADLAAGAEALQGKLPTVFHVDRAADILATLKLSREYGLRPVLASATEAWRVRRRLAAARVPVIAYPLSNLPNSFAERHVRDDAVTLLHAAGVAVALSTGETHNARKLRQVAGNAIRAGLPRDAALAAITSVPARIAGLDARYGTLAPGHVANLVLWSEDPFELSSRPELVVIRGRSVPLRSRQTLLLERYRTPPG